MASTTANPTAQRPAQAAPTSTTAAEDTTAVTELLAARAERYANPPGTRLRSRPVAITRPANRPAHREIRAQPVRRKVAHPHSPARVRHRHLHAVERVFRHTARRITRHVFSRRAPIRLGAAAAVVSFALAQRGDPYVHDADGPNSWDCSGLTKEAFARVGIDLPHRAASQSARGRAVSRSAARAGDLVAWGGTGSAYHVGIYLGGGRVLHSPRPGKSVQVAQLWGDPQFRRLL